MDVWVLWPLRHVELFFMFSFIFLFVSRHVFVCQ